MNAGRSRLWLSLSFTCCATFLKMNFFWSKYWRPRNGGPVWKHHCATYRDKKICIPATGDHLAGRSRLFQFDSVVFADFAEVAEFPAEFGCEFVHESIIAQGRRNKRRDK